MKKITLLLILIATVLFSCKKEDSKGNENNGQTTTTGNIQFFTFTSDFGSPIPMDNVIVELNSHKDTTGTDGRATFSDIDAGSYSFKAVKNINTDVYEASGSVTVTAGGTFVKNVPMKKIAGSGELRFQFLAGTTAISGGEVILDTAFSNISNNTAMSSTLTNSNGVAEFSGLNTGTYYFGFNGQINSISYDTTGAVALPADNRYLEFSIKF